MLLDLSIPELAIGLKEKKFTSVNLIEEAYKQIDAWNNQLNALVTVIAKDEAIKQAVAKDNARTGNEGLLYGLPFVIKDSYATAGVRTTAASKVLETFIPPYSATVYRKLIDAGAILVGKGNMDSWGHGATSENSAFGPVKNPWDLTRVSGGSTGGCAAAVSTRMCAFAIGEDTGGSIRNPSAWCNTTGLKVTYGRVSRYGCIAYASSFDTVGPMGKSVIDCAAVLEVVAGKDPYDATSSPHEVSPYLNMLKPEKLTIGIPKEVLNDSVDPEIKQALDQVASIFSNSGMEIKHISMPTLDYGISTYYVIAPSETSSNLARYDGVRYGTGRENFSEENMRRIMIGTYALSTGYYDAYYRKAQKARTLFIEEYKRAFTQCDIILMPVTPYHATKLGEVINDPMQNMLTDAFTITHNPVGIPSLAMQAGFSSTGLPIGVQICAPMFEEARLFAAGHTYQQKTDWHKKAPKI